MHTWLNANKLTLTVTINEFMLKGSDERLNTITTFPSVAMNGSRVKQVATTKSLGVTINVYSGFQVTGMIEWGRKHQPPPPKKKKITIPRNVCVCFFIILAEVVITGH